MAACACASQARLYGYNEIKDILERGDDVDFMPSSDEAIREVNQASPAKHKNIRGRDYYSTNKPTNKKSNENGNE